MNSEVQRDNAIKSLRETIARGSTIYVLLRHKNEMGTCRWLEFYHAHESELKRITWEVTLAVQGEYCRERDALRFFGTGLDSGFASVHDLSEALFDTGRALKHRWL